MNPAAKELHVASHFGQRGASYCRLSPAVDMLPDACASRSRRRGPAFISAHTKRLCRCRSGSAVPGFVRSVEFKCARSEAQQPRCRVVDLVGCTPAKERHARCGLSSARSCAYVSCPKSSDRHSILVLRSCSNPQGAAREERGDAERRPLRSGDALHHLDHHVRSSMGLRLSQPADGLLDGRRAPAATARRTAGSL